MSDASGSSGLLVEAPVSRFADQLGIDYRDFFVALGKATVSGLVGFATGNPGAFAGAVKEVVGAYSAFGDATTLREVHADDPGALAWLLIHEALVDAVTRLVLDHNARFRAAYLDRDLPDVSAMGDRLADTLDVHLADAELRITSALFDAPADLDVVEEVQKDLRQWFETLGIDAGEAQAVAGHLRGYFRRSFIQTWRQHREYHALADVFEMRLADLEQRLDAWADYRAFLQAQVDEPVFGEAVSLRQVYVWPRAYFLQTKNDERRRGSVPAAVDAEAEPRLASRHSDRTRRVVDLKTAVLDWLHATDASDAIRIVSADPGIGKSSFSKMLADALAETNRMPVLYLPLHALDTSKGLREAVLQYLHDAQLFPQSVNPFEEDELLLLLDGLDELSMQGAVGARQAKEWVREVRDKVNTFNQTALRVRVLLSGRKIAAAAAQEVLRDPSCVFHLIPFAPKDDPDASNEPPYADPDALLATDQRHDWWTRYGEVTGADYSSGMPDALRTDRLDDITTQPLLNYLVALAYEDDPAQFDDDASLNTVYAHLLDGVYTRDYDFGPHPGADVLSGEDADAQKRGFLRVLEEIALDAWHGDGRTTTVPSIEQRCESANLERHFAVVREKLADGITQLLAAFYFRRSGQTPKGVETFEFTHKTFAEYLTARRIVRAVEEVHDLHVRYQTGRKYGKSVVECLEAWIDVCGPSAMDEDLYRFVKDEVRLALERHTAGRDGETTIPDAPTLDDHGADVEAWQQTFADFLRHTIPHDVPMETVDANLSFQEQKRWARNAEEAILAVVHACRLALIQGAPPARPEDQTSPYAVDVFSESTRETAGDWLRRMQAAYLETGLGITPGLLGSIRWAGCNSPLGLFFGADLTHADLRGADLSGAVLTGAVLTGAVLTGADLTGADLTGAVLRGAVLMRAVLSGAVLRDADLSRADLIRADLTGADLTGAVLRGAVLSGAVLSGAVLRGANLSGAVLRGADFEHARINAQTRMSDDLREYVLSRGAVVVDD